MGMWLPFRLVDVHGECRRVRLVEDVTVEIPSLLPAANSVSMLN